MALKVGELYAALGLQDSSFYKGLDKAEKSLNNSAAKFAKIGAGLTLGVTLPLVKLGKEVFDAATNFESAFAGVKKTVDATDAEYAKFEKDIIGMSKSIPATAVAISDVAAAAGQLGIQNKYLMDFSRTMIDLGESTNLTATDAATELARFANITNMAQNKFTNLGSSIVELGNNFATTEAEIVAMGMRLAGTGSQLGLSDAKIMGISAALSSVGIEAEAGGTAMSSFLKRVNLATSKGGKDLKNFAKVAGMSSKDFKKLFKEDAGAALQSFITGLGKSKDATKTLADMGITDIRMSDTLLRLAGSGDLLTRAMEASSTAFDENTALSEEAQKRYATMASQLQIVKNNVMELARQFGVALTPYVEKAGLAIQALSNWFEGLSPETKDMIVKVGMIAAAIGPATALMGGMAKSLALVFKAMKFGISPLGLIGAGLFVLYKTSPRVQKAVKKLTAFFGKFFDLLGDGYGFVDALKISLIRAFGGDTYRKIRATFDSIGAAWNNTAKWMQDTGIGLSEAWNKGSAQGGFFGGIVESAKYLGGRISEALKSGWETVKQAGKDLASKALGAAGEALKDTTYFSGLGVELIKASFAIQEGKPILWASIFSKLLRGAGNALLNNNTFKGLGIELIKASFKLEKGESINWDPILAAIVESITPAVQQFSVDVGTAVGIFTKKVLDAFTGGTADEIDKANPDSSRLVHAFMGLIGRTISGLFLGVAAGILGIDISQGLQAVRDAIGNKMDIAWLNILEYAGLGDSQEANFVRSQIDEFNQSETYKAIQEYIAKVGDPNTYMQGTTTNGGTTPTIEAKPPTVKPTAPSFDLSGLDIALQTMGFGSKPIEADIPIMLKAADFFFEDKENGTMSDEAKQQIADMLSDIDWSKLGVTAPDFAKDGIQITELDTALYKIVDLFGTSGQDAVDGFTGALDAGNTQASTSGAGLGTSAVNGLDGAGGIDAGSPSKKTTKSGVNFDLGFIRGMNQLRSSVITTAEGIGRAAHNAFSKALQEGSPSKLTFKSGRNFDLGFINGVESLRRKVVATTGNLAAMAGTLRIPRSPLSGARNPVSIRQISEQDYGGLIRAIYANPPRVFLDGREISRGTVVYNAREEARRTQRINAGYGTVTV